MRRMFSLGFPLFVLLLLVLTAPAYGEEGQASSHDAMEFRTDTALWSVVVFAGLFAILYFKAWPPVLEGLQKREESIRTSLEEAKKVRSDMAAMKAEFDAEMAKAHQEIPRLMEEARKKGDEAAAQKLAEASAKIQADQERFRQEMTSAKDQAIRELWEQAAQLATLISAKTLGRSLTEDDHRRLLDEAMQEMTQATRN